LKAMRVLVTGGFRGSSALTVVDKLQAGRGARAGDLRPGAPVRRWARGRGASTTVLGSITDRPRRLGGAALHSVADAGPRPPGRRVLAEPFQRTWHAPSAGRDAEAGQHGPRHRHRSLEAAPPARGGSSGSSYGIDDLGLLGTATTRGGSNEETLLAGGPSATCYTKHQGLRGGEPLTARAPTRSCTGSTTTILRFRDSVRARAAPGEAAVVPAVRRQRRWRGEPLTLAGGRAASHARVSCYVGGTWPDGGVALGARGGSRTNPRLQPSPPTEKRQRFKQDRRERSRPSGPRQRSEDRPTPRARARRTSGGKELCARRRRPEREARLDRGDARFSEGVARYVELARRAGASSPF